MRRPLNPALRCAAIVVVTVLFAAVVSSSPGPVPSPYVSALSGVVAGSVYAAPSACGNSGCNRYGHCSKVRGSNCQYAAGECDQSAC
jgi:hypothetical protein